MGQKLVPEAPGPPRLPDRSHVLAQQVAHRFVVGGAGQHVTVGGHGEQPVARGAATVPEAARHGIEDAHGRRGVPHELHAGRRAGRGDGLQVGRQFAVAQRQVVVDGRASGRDDQVHAEPRQVEPLPDEPGQFRALAHVPPVQRRVGVDPDSGPPEMAHRGDGPGVRALHRRDRIVGRGADTLEAHLRGVQTGPGEPGGEIRRDPRPVGYQVDQETQPLRVADQLRKIGAQGRLAAGEADRGRLALFPDLAQHGADLRRTHLPLIARRVGRAIAPGVAEQATEIAAIGQRHLGQDRQPREGQPERTKFHCRRPVELVQRSVQTAPDLEQELRDRLRPSRIVTRRIEDLADARAIQQRLQDPRPRTVELLRLVGPLDQQAVLEPDEDVGPHVVDELIDPGHARPHRLAGPAHQCEPPLTQAE